MNEAVPTASEVVIRPVGPFEVGRLARLHRGCFAEPWQRAELSRLLALPGGFALIARVAGPGVVGFDTLRGAGFALSRIAADECELLSLGVLPALRGVGLGHGLLLASLRRAWSGGAQAMFLEVAIDNRSALQLYTRAGFVTVGTRKQYYARADGDRVDALTMRRQLTPELLVEPA